MFTQRFTISRNRFILPRLIATAFTFAAGFSLLPPTRAAAQDMTLEPAKSATLINIALPANAQRFKSEESIDKMMSAVRSYADDLLVKTGKGEVFGWELAKNDDTARQTIKDGLMARWKETGYTFHKRPGKFDMNGVPTTLFQLKKPGQATIIGYWLDAPDALLLGWAKIVSDPNNSNAKASTPKEMLGVWSATMLSNTQMVISSTGAYVDSGGVNGVQRYEFKPDGTYSMHTYIKSRSYGRLLETYTWEYGKVIPEGNSVILKPTSGKYKVTDSLTEKNNYTRPMTDEEIKKHTKRYYWNRQESKLMIGSDASALVEYRPLK
ncbi:MAG: hypothetical protein OHK0029_01480 [Armatimonadaceae bacterium]